MKKLAFLVGLTSLFFASCNFLENITNNGTGSIVVDLGSRERTVTPIANEDMVTSYAINISGTDYSDTQDCEPGGTVFFNNLVPGTYTIKGLAYHNDEFFAAASTTVTVKSMDTTEAILTFIQTSFFESKFILYNYYEDSLSNKGYYFEVYDSFDPSLDLSVDHVNSLSNIGHITENANGDIFYTQSPLIYKYDSFQPKILSDVTDASGKTHLVVSDPFNDRDYYFLFSASDTAANLSFEPTSISQDFIPEITFTHTFYESGETLPSSIEKIICYKETFFVLYTSYFGGTYLMILTPDYMDDSFNIHARYSAKDFGFNEYTEIRDIAMPTSGELYMLVGENYAYQDEEDTINYPSMSRKFTYANPCDDSSITSTSFYNRGALVKLSYDSKYQEVKPVKTIGWYPDNKVRKLRVEGEFTVNENLPEDKLSAAQEFAEDAKYELTALDLYAPSKRESSNYFYGPERIVCIKPDELYIVDSGFNVRLADWKAVDRSSDCVKDYPDEYVSEQPGLTSNIFNHDRIVKVDLSSFALSIEKEEISMNEVIKSNDGGYSLVPAESLFAPFDCMGFQCLVSPSSIVLGVHPNPEEPED